MRSILVFPLFAVVSLHGLPGNLQVASGSADLTLASPEVLEILVSDRSILNWGEFSIGENEKVIFNQPDAASCTLNRVLGENPSRLLGSLEANGKVLLLNPKGVLFGEGARIDVGSFTASTLDINDEVFLANQKWRFEDGWGSGSISVLGSISAKGEVVLAASEIACQGSIHVPSGRVEFFGDRLSLLGKGEIDVSGPEKGGVVLFGGDFQGKSRDLPNASMVFFGPETVVRADALDQGDGGKLILWSDRQTFFFGSASAKGGARGGNGGFVEVSGLGELVYQGSVSTWAPSGIVGTLLLDPIGFTISSGATAMMSAPPPAAFTTSTPTAAGANLNSANLQTALGSNSVILMTSAASAAAGNIVWQSTGSITWNAPTNLTVLAHNDITLNASITNTAAAPGGSLYFVAGWDGTTTLPPFAAGTFGNPNGFTGNILIDNSAGLIPNMTISTSNGTVNFLSQNFNLQNTNALSGDLIISAPSAAGSIGIVAQTTQNFTVIGGTGSISQPVTFQSTNGGIAFTAGGNITFQAGNSFNSNSSTATCRGPINFTAGGSVTVDSGGANDQTVIQTSGPNGAGDINFSAGTDIAISQTAPSAVINQEKVFIRNTGGGSINFSAPNGNIFANTTNVALQITQIGLLATTTNVTFTSLNSIQISTRGPSGGQNVMASNSITFTTTSPTGSILLGNGVGVGPSSLTVQTSTGPIQMTSNSITLQGGTGSVESVIVTSNLGNVILNATPSGNLSLIGGSTTGNSNVLVNSTQASVTLNAPGGNVLFQGGSVAGAGAVAQANIGGVTVTAGGNVSLLAGTSNSCPTRIVTTSGPIMVTAGGNLSLQGGSAGTNASFSEILATTGNIILTLGGNISLTGVGAYARVQTTSGTLTASGNNLTMASGTTGSGFGFPPFTALSCRDGSIGVTLRGNLSMTGGLDPLAYTAIGWRTAGAETATAPINLDVGGTASLFGGPNAANVTNYAQIGHIGGGTLGGGGVAQTGSANAAIAVRVRNGAASLTALQLIGADNAAANTLSNAMIGHGGAFWNSGNATGNIQVTVDRGNVLMQGGRTNDFAAIGHVALSPASTSSILGATTVNIQSGNLLVIPPLNTGSTNSPAGIYHFAPSVLAGSSIQVTVNGNASLGGGRSTSMALIGASGNAAGGVSLDPPVIVCVTGNLLLGNPGGASGIGLVAPGVPLNLAIGDVMVSVGGNASLSPTMVGTNNGEHIAFIGTPNAQTLGAGPFSSNTFLAVQGSLSVLGDVNGTDLVNNNAEVYGLNDANIGVAGNVTVRGGFRNARIGSRLQAPLSTVQLWAGGDILFQNSNLGGLGQLGSTGLAGQGGNIDARAAGDIRLSSSIIPTAAAASILIQGGSSFPAGALFSTSGGGISTVDGQTATGFLCLAVTSPAVGPDPGNNLGTVRIDTAGYNSAGVLVTPAAPPGITLQTINGNLTVNSADRFQTSDPNYGIVSGTFSNLTLAGAGTNAMVLLSTTGNITVAGPSPTDSFHDITVNTVPSPWTAGNIFMSANNNMTVNSTISTNGAGSSITLIADQNDTNVDGPGILTINANVTTAAGPILLDAGFGPALGVSSINQTAGTVNSNGGSIRAQAVGNIAISGSATSFSSGAGNQSIESTTGNIQIDEDVIATSGNVTVLAAAQNVIFSTATGSGGSIQTTTGAVSVTAAQNITINGDPTTLFSGSGSITTLAGDDTTETTNVLTGGPILMISGNNMFMLGSANITSSGSSVTLVVDNDFPSPPLIGPGFFNMAAGAQVNSASTLRIFTAQQPFNTILGLLNGNSFTAGTIFQNTNSEVWCTYYPSGVNGSPFTVFYKNCLQQVTQQAAVVVQQFLFNIQLFNNPNWPYYGLDDFYGWPTKFYLVFHELKGYEDYPSEPYFLRTGNRLLLAPHPGVLRSEWRPPLR